MSVAPLLLAQLAAPPVQPGPVRLPAPLELRRPATPAQPLQLEPPAPEPAPPRSDTPETPNPPAVPSAPGAPETPVPSATPILPAPPNAPRPSRPTTPPPSPGRPAPDSPLSSPLSAFPEIRGLARYDSATLRRILAPCAAVAGAEERLRCRAAALSSRLVRDGYVNSRVIAVREPAPGRLEVIEGRIEEVRVEGPDPALNRRLLRRLLPLQGRVLHLPSLEATVQQLQRLAGVGLLQANLNRLGSDPSRAVLLVSAEPRARTLQGEVSLRNDGSPGSGQFRALATLLQNDLLSPGDALLLFGELNTNSAPALGYGSGSLSYSLPLGDTLRLSTAFGASRRHLIELEEPARSLSYRQLQTLIQLDATLAEFAGSRWFGFAGLSANRADSFQAGRALPLLVGASGDGWLRTGFLRLGFGGEGESERLRWSGSVYGLQGLAGLSTDSQRQNLALFGIHPGEARAMGLLAGLQWRPARRWQVSFQAAAQQAFAPLPAAMGLSLGSDNGLRGLPGQVISGDSGLLGEVEASWSAWRGRRQELQLVPFLGAGLVRTETPGGWIRGDVGAGGVLLRWLQGRHWLAELGWVSQFGGSDPSLDDRWLLSNGLYSRLQFRF